MSTKPAQLRSEPHNIVGTAILRDTGVIIERWARRAAEEQPSAQRVHHDVLLDHLPTFLWELGRGLAEAHGQDPFRHCRTANAHGDQRWETGWSVEEVVRDYQLLRVVVTEYLDETIGRPLHTREVMALGVFIDDAIASSVAAYLGCQNAVGAPGELAGSSGDPDLEDLLGVLAVLGHELRNPLAPLGNALQILKLSGGDQTTVEQARLLMERQFHVMTRLVDDLLDLPRLVRGKMRLQPERLDLVRLARDVVDDRRGAFEEAEIGITLDAPAGPVWTTGDISRLSQVLGNLLGNAQKFTNRGGEVRVWLASEVDRRVAILGVQDTGIGIDPVVLPNVFDAFVQADRSVERSRGGLGLGLALVKGIVELHGGAVRASSRGPGTGSEFVVELPLIDLSTGDPVPQRPGGDAIASRRIMVIEDNRDSAESLKLLLEIYGHQVAVAGSGSEGVALATATAPDVVICDIGLPGMSGHMVCAELRKLSALAKTLFVALSGHPPDGVEAEVSGGFDIYLLKPVEPARLAEVISTHPARDGQ